MSKASLIKVVDLLSFIGLLALISTGSVLELILPAKSGAATVWGLTRHEWGDIHFYVSVIFLILLSLHLWLHIRFIKSVIVGKASREHNYRIAVGLVALLVLLLFTIAPLFSSVEDEGGRHWHTQEPRR
ncbi:DUF4405 domain-containing protein [Thalassotalea mangrovi]|uniref:DUF4405 domain-containing protein n=1 Tax=Thalassotalea mangrovi TaxID=2572245 RepID=A0A4U1B7M7_9GAMM|nr:DUF4405 domain-containing protein [Thalassotalea mangrovi]TKB45960.1 DUF4405 domain-containing protein [Thalassotalea mangrovi]